MLRIVYHMISMAFQNCKISRVESAFLLYQKSDDRFLLPKEKYQKSVTPHGRMGHVAVMHTVDMAFLAGIWYLQMGLQFHSRALHLSGGWIIGIKVHSISILLMTRTHNKHA